METLSRNLKEIREKQGLSPRQLARKADLADESVLGIEAGTNNPTIKTLEKIANVLGCEVVDLIR